MEKTIEMLVEYVLEENTGLKTEKRRLEKDVTHLTEQNDRLYEDVAKNADKLARLAKQIKLGVMWNDSDEPDYITIVNTPIVREICEMLRIDRDGKATL